MDWTNLIWLGLGFGFGLISRRFWRGTPRKGQAHPEIAPEIAPPPLMPSPTFPGDTATIAPQEADNMALQAASPASSNLDNQLQQLQLAYQMATEMSQFKGGFLARASHELRSPLNGLIGMHQLILSDLCDSPEEEREFIAQANESAKRMVDVLDRILDVARVQHGTVEMDIQPIQLTHILQEVHDLTYLQARNRNLQLQVSLPDPELYVLVDPRRFRQVLIHFVDAAISRLPEKPITITTQPVFSSGQIHIWIDDHCPAADRSEPIHFMDGDFAAHLTNLSPGLTLLADQMLLQLMQGNVKVVPIASDSQAPSDFTRIQCSIPLATEE